MTRWWTTTTILLAALLALVVCNGSIDGGDGDGDVDGDSDTDSDTDSDSDADDVCPGGCPAGERCVSGRCVATCTGAGDCTAPYQCCDGACVNVREDVNNCNACGNACGSLGDGCIGGVCSCNGAVACADPMLCCGTDGCVDVSENERNCGGCGSLCDGNCVGGVCEECSADAHEASGGNTCSDAQPLGSLSDAGEQQILTGNLYPDGDRDCFWFTAEDVEDAECDAFHVDIRFTANPEDQFALEVFRGSCEAPECATEPYVNYSWATDFLSTEGEEWRGECPCRAESVDGTQTCSDNTAVFRFCIIRVAGEASGCGWYEVEVSNGVYSTTEE